MVPIFHDNPLKSNSYGWETMMTTGKRLGRGLAALLGGVEGLEPESGNTTEEHGNPSGSKIDITKIVPNPFQPRKVFDENELEQLGQSLQAHGLLHSIIVRQVGERYQIVAGERRFRAALRMGWSEIPAEIRHDIDDRQMAELALVENVQRKDLNAIEKATSFANYLEVYGGTHEELAKRLEIDRSTVTNMLRLLALPKPLQDAVCQEQISSGHVRALLRLEEWEQVEIAAKIQAEGWSVRETERFVQDLTLTGEAELPKKPGQNWNVVGPDGSTRAVSKQSEHVQQLEEEFRHALGGMKVRLIQTNEKGKGKLVISFANHTEFEHVYVALCKSKRAAG
jgi:ParB family chromosome partitioning protein